MWLQLLLYLVLGIFALFLYMGRNKNYWKNKGVPYLSQSFDLKMLFALHLHEIDLANYKKYGRIYGHFEGPKPGLTVAVPELLRDITIKDFQTSTFRRDFKRFDEVTNNMVSTLNGEKWKKLRSAITPVFSSGKMRKMTSLILECAETTSDNFGAIADKKAPTDLKRIFGAFTMDVIATTAFGMKIDSHNDPENPFVKQAQKIFTRGLNFGFLLIILFPFLARFFRPTLFQGDAINFFKKITEDLIQERRKNPDVKRYDFLQILLDEADVHEEETPKENGATSKESSKGLSNMEILANCVLFFIAGYETTASTLSFISYHLALYPECQDRLAEEIKTVLMENENVIDYDTVKKMPYLEAVILETLRIFPPAIRTERQAVEDYTLGDTGITIPKGMMIGIPIYSMHHDPENFPNPEIFDPERFLPENKSSIKPFTFMPFGSGPRNCLAERFALLEIKLCLAKLIPKYKFIKVPETKIPPKFYTAQGLLVPTDITLKVEKRS